MPTANKADIDTNVNFVKTTICYFVYLFDTILHKINIILSAEGYMLYAIG
jgi:hypothetical protein